MTDGARQLEGFRPELLNAVLDRVLPGYGELPPAGEMGLGDGVIDDASASPPMAAALERLLGGLPDDFCELDGEAQDEALRLLETTQPDAFATLITLAYTAYYTDGRVLDFVARESSYVPGPPQPRGYQLEPFDEASLSQMKRREPLWRKTD